MCGHSVNLGREKEKKLSSSRDINQGLRPVFCHFSGSKRHDHTADVLGFASLRTSS